MKPVNVSIHTIVVNEFINVYVYHKIENEGYSYGFLDCVNKSKDHYIELLFRKHSDSFTDVHSSYFYDVNDINAQDDNECYGHPCLLVSRWMDSTISPSSNNAGFIIRVFLKPNGSAFDDCLYDTYRYEPTSNFIVYSGEVLQLYPGNLDRMIKYPKKIMYVSNINALMKRYINSLVCYEVFTYLYLAKYSNLDISLISNIASYWQVNPIKFNKNFNIWRNRADTVGFDHHVGLCSYVPSRNKHDCCFHTKVAFLFQSYLNYMDCGCLDRPPFISIVLNCVGKIMCMFDGHIGDSYKLLYTKNLIESIF